MGALIKRIIAAPETRQFLLYLLSSLIGGFAASEIHSPKVTAAWMPGWLRSQEPPADPLNAIGRISFGRSGCTATVIGPVKSTDTTIRILTAAHCVKVGQEGTMVLKDGRTFPVKCVTLDKDADCAWLTAIRPKGTIPYARLATTLPAPGASVWHHGYGIDKPNNREDGVYNGLSADRLQLQFTLSVSPGDSGGGIITNTSGEVLSPVCCTSRLSARGTVYGAHPARSLALRPGSVVACCADDGPEPPRINPIIPLPHPGWPKPLPEGPVD